MSLGEASFLEYSLPPSQLWVLADSGATNFPSLNSLHLMMLGVFDDGDREEGSLVQKHRKRRRTRVSPTPTCMRTLHTLINTHYSHKG